MKRPILAFIAALIVAGLGIPRPAHAAAPLLPAKPAAALYPAGTTFARTDPLSNFEKSCSWDLDCSNGATPVAHSTDEDALGRVGGWLVFAEWQGRHGQQMTFTLFGSFYDTPAHARAAAADYQTQLTGHTFQMASMACPPALPGTGSTWFCALHHDRKRIGGRYGHYFSLAAATGTVEIELLTYANTRYHALRHFTFAQAQAAVGSD